MIEIFSFDKREILEISIAVFVLTIIFSFEGLYFNSNLLGISFLAVITAFLLHELAHKFSAIKLGYHARFRLYIPSTLLSLILVFTGVKVAAPDFPKPLIEQLKVGGIILAIIGYHDQYLVKGIKKSEKEIERKVVLPVVFLPLKGKYGWDS